MDRSEMFSKEVPALQVAWDASSFYALQFCPRYYKITILDGWRVSSVDLDFGTMVHGAMEVFWNVFLRTRDKVAAQVAALRAVMEASWGEDEEGRPKPWGGRYMEMWRCSGTEPFKNEKGNKAKCPFSHVGKWFLSDPPSTCGSCGSPIQVESRWVPQDKVKDRYGLVRAVFALTEEPGPEPRLVPGRDGVEVATVEIPFRLPLHCKAQTTDDQFILCGTMDRIAWVGEEGFVVDLKTSKAGMTEMYFSWMAPNAQFDLYDLAAASTYPDFNISGVLVEGVQLLQSGVNLGQHLFRKTREQREELTRDLKALVLEAERYAVDGYWPMRRSSCRMCKLRKFCSMPPEYREQHIEAELDFRPWNPLRVRKSTKGAAAGLDKR